jgi:hypothetical protein
VGLSAVPMQPAGSRLRAALDWETGPATHAACQEALKGGAAAGTQGGTHRPAAPQELRRRGLVAAPAGTRSLFSVRRVNIMIRTEAVTEIPLRVAIESPCLGR